jgi:ribose transport system substrate-binding protein
LLVLSACGANTEKRSDADAKSLKLAFVTNNSADFWTIARRGVEQADGELNDVSAEFRMPSDGSAAEQKRIIDDLITKGVNGIAISPVDPGNQVALINDASRKALVITQDSDAPDTERACYIGTDNTAAGRQAGQLIKEALPDGGKIMLSSASSMRKTRRTAFRASRKRCRGRRYKSSTSAPTMWMTSAPNRTPRTRL